jgi:hypothetical protein
MKITGFTLIKGGTAGISVEGIDLVASGNDRAMFKDDLKRTRKFPLTVQLRKAIAVLNYPFLVGTEHWKPEFAQRMREDFSSPDYKSDPAEKIFKTLNSFWQSTQITKCAIDKGNYKITGEIACQMCTIKATVSVAPDNDHSLYSLVQDALENIVRMIDQTLNLPQLALGTTDEIREIYNQVSKDTEDTLDEGMNPDDAFLSLMKLAQGKGYGIVLDDNMLGQLAAHVPDEDAAMMGGSTFKIDEDLPELDEALGLDPEAQIQFENDLAMEQIEIENAQAFDTAKIKSMQTKDPSIFVQEPEEHIPGVGGEAFEITITEDEMGSQELVNKIVADGEFGEEFTSDPEPEYGIDNEPDEIL